MSRPRLSTVQRGYGSKHRALRRALLPQAIGTPCVRCGIPMLNPEDMDLDHSDDRSTYLGFAHSECNRRAAGEKAQRLARNPKHRSATQW